jgi:hypothetical protein
LIRRDRVERDERVSLLFEQQGRLRARRRVNAPVGD